MKFKRNPGRWTSKRRASIFFLCIILCCKVSAQKIDSCYVYYLGVDALFPVALDATGVMALGHTYFLTGKRADSVTAVIMKALDLSKKKKRHLEKDEHCRDCRFVIFFYSGGIPKLLYVNSVGEILYNKYVYYNQRRLMRSRIQKIMDGLPVEWRRVEE